MSTNVVQYVVVRRDVLKTLKWPVGALIAQACHACTAVMHNFYNHPDTQNYLKDLDNMHKVILEAKDEESLRSLSSVLTENSIDHKLWIEQPENISTCIAVRPYNKETVQQFFKEFKLFR
ncbi:putative peptidyl-tRNA hydrolase PTRHD1 [Mytilus californianus]|uniref:putative peptidyl-tRNA hydrolase PTRHD1 n=1 Tax=Mytilus californianus TaxID=6549 RepID=UPI002247928E|nr:putative peptidyl-tRNA hydrolase PTRHD1 [Mytilus californianus]